MNTLTIISSKDPTVTLVKCVRRILKHHKTDVIVIDSGSTKKKFYKKIDVPVYFMDNKNYELGAYKIGYEMFPNYEKYICIQDTFLSIKKMDIQLDDKTVYVFEKDTGFSLDKQSFEESKKLWKDTIYYDKLLELENKKFIFSQHNSFIVNNIGLYSLLNFFTKLPENKLQSCATERLIYLYFKFNNYKFINLYKKFKKFHGNRV